MTKTQFVLDADLSLDFSLWALHTTLSGYSLAFHLNKTLNSRFTRAQRDLKTEESEFAFYQWDQPQQGIYCELLQNKTLQQLEDQGGPANLFEVETTKEVYLLPEVKQVPFLLKIHEGIAPQIIKKSLERGEAIQIYYILAEKKLKSKLNILTLKWRSEKKLK